MKKFLLLSLAIIGLLASCKTSSHTNCDAYGFSDSQDEFDIHAMSVDSNSKYVTSVKLK